MNLKKAKAFVSNNLKILFFSTLIGSGACMIAVFAFSSPGVNQPPSGNPVFWLLSGTSMYYSAGSVGIGTSSPSTALEVNGRIKDQTGFVMPVGLISTYGGSVAPVGWLICNGAAISRTTYADLFAVIGTTYGVGDGSTTFNLPDLRGVFVRGSGTSGKLTNANGAAFSGVLGTYQNDEFQGHYHNIKGQGGQTFNGVGYSTQAGGDINFLAGNDAVAAPPYWYVGNSIADGANGTPRIGAETNPANLSLNHIIKY